MFRRCYKFLEFSICSVTVVNADVSGATAPNECLRNTLPAMGGLSLELFEHCSNQALPMPLLRRTTLISSLQGSALRIIWQRGQMISGIVDRPIGDRQQLNLK